MFRAIWQKTLGAPLSFDSDLLFQLSINTNTFQMATIIVLGCKRKTSKKHCQNMQLKTFWRHVTLLHGRSGLNAQGSCCIWEALAKTCTYANQTTVSRGHPQRIYFKSLSVCLWRALMSMLKMLPFLEGQCGGGKPLEKVKIRIAKRRRQNHQLSKGFSVWQHLSSCAASTVYLTLYSANYVYWDAFSLINGRQNKDFHDYFTWKIL